jgi:hypothetical protein
MAAEHHIYLLCGGDLGVISPLRVAHLLLERLGGGGQDARNSTAVVQVRGRPGGGAAGLSHSPFTALKILKAPAVEHTLTPSFSCNHPLHPHPPKQDLHDLAYRAALSPGLDNLPPTLVASGIVRLLRRRRGQWPSWPGALETLTGLNPAAADFSGVVAELEASVLEAERTQQQQQPPAACASPSPSPSKPAGAPALSPGDGRAAAAAGSPSVSPGGPGGPLAAALQSLTLGSGSSGGALAPAGDQDRGASPAGGAGGGKRRGRGAAGRGGSDPGRSDGGNSFSEI